MNTTDKNKVLYVDTPLEPPGGGQQSLLLILQYLNKTNFQSVVFMPEGGEFSKLLAEKNICYKIVKPEKLFFEIKRLNPEIIHCNSPTTRYAFYTALASKLLGIPFIWHVRVIESAGWRDKMIASLSTKIITISDAVKRKFSYVKDSKVIKIYNAVDTEVFEPRLDTEYLYKEFNISKDKKLVGIFSRLDPWKGHKLFIDSAKIVKESFKNTIFLIVGEGDKSYKKQLSEYTEIKGLKGSIMFAGFRRDIPQLMNLCDVVVNPSVESEPFGRTIIEAMACGRPVIATNIGAPKEIIEDKTDGFLVRPDSESIAELVIKLLQSKDLKNKIGNRAREKVIEKFSVESQTKGLERLYNSLSCVCV